MFKGPPAGLGQFQTFESHIKKDENAFYFLLKALFVLEIFAFLCWLFGLVKKRLDKKAMINFKIYDNFKYLKKKRLFRARSSLTFRQLQSVDSLWNAYVTWQEHPVKKRQSDNKREEYFLQKSSWKWERETSSRFRFFF